MKQYREARAKRKTAKKRVNNRDPEYHVLYSTNNEKYDTPGTDSNNYYNSNDIQPTPYNRNANRQIEVHAGWKNGKGIGTYPVHPGSFYNPKRNRWEIKAFYNPKSKTYKVNPRLPFVPQFRGGPAEQDVGYVIQKGIPFK